MTGTSDDFYENYDKKQAADKPAPQAAQVKQSAPVSDDEAKRLLAAVSPSGPAVVECWHCHRKIHDVDHYCRHCGKGQGAYIPWTYKPAGIVVMTLFLGPFALWYVWRSPALSSRTKWIITGVMTVVTVYLAVSLYKFYMAFMSMLVGGGSLAVMRDINGM